MKPITHAIAGTLVMLLIAGFLGATAYAELSGDGVLILDVKRSILYGLCLLIPAMAIAGGSGFSLADGRTGPLIAAKKARMRLVAGNGLIVLLPSAIWLYIQASAGRFDAGFVAVQAIEIIGGLVQLYLLGRNFRDGLKLSGRLRRMVSHKTKTAG